METERAKRLANFVSWVGANIKGDEKGEAQVFLDRFFQAFGHAGLKEAGATLEERIKKADGKGISFADLVWKPVVLIEMKKRGEDLARHYRQAFDYWTRLVRGRPRYVMLCGGCMARLARGDEGLHRGDGQGRAFLRHPARGGSGRAPGEDGDGIRAGPPFPPSWDAVD